MNAFEEEKVEDINDDNKDELIEESKVASVFQVAEVKRPAIKRIKLNWTL